MVYKGINISAMRLILYLCVKIFLRGVHHQNSKDIFDVSYIILIHELLETASEHLFPDRLNVFHKKAESISNVGNGGWGDARDHELCLRIANRSSRQLVFSKFHLFIILAISYW